ncbi:MAG: hypothetical protein CO099_01735 [Bdellovibrio sp. CG_4_9_14_3_um_filter_39_7]|nr:MAG: hypothetical protein CO099_01735 [Bdellovibrio sp. CG_4_9_14_3_um_filter_39_7]
MAYTVRPGFVTKIVDRIVNYPKTSLFMTMILMALTMPGLLQFQEKYDVRIWFRDSDPLIKTLNAFERQFGNDENIVILMNSPSGMFDRESIEALRNITHDAWQIPEVIRVESLSNYNYTHAEGDDIIIDPFLSDELELTDSVLKQKKEIALKHKVMPDYLISRDGKSAMIFARLAINLEGSPNYENIVRETRKIIKKYEGQSDHTFHLIGEAAVNDAFREVANHDGAVILPILFALIIAYLIWVFRSLSAMMFPLAITLISVMMTMGLVFEVGYEFNNILTILPAILISISIADSVHIMMTFFQFRAQGKEHKEAVYYALHKNFIPTFLTSFTTAIGFISLSMTELLPIRQLGSMAAAGCVFAWILTLFWMGPLLLVVPFKIPKSFLKLKDSELNSDFSVKMTSLIHRFRWSIVIFFTLAVSGSIYLSTKVEVNSNPYEYFTEHIPLRKANDFVRKSFGGNAGPEILFYSGKDDGIKDPAFLRKVDEFKTWLNSLEHINKTVDIVDIVKEMNQELHGGSEEYYRLPETQEEVAQYLFLYTMSLPQGMDLKNRMTINNDALRMSILWDVWDSKGWLKYTDEIEEHAKKMGLTIAITGKFLLFQRMMGYVVETFIKSIAMAMILISLVMSIYFRSLRAGLLSMVPNGIPILFVGGLLYFSGIPLNIGSSLVASVCLGIAVDDTIHFLANYYRLRKEGHTIEESIASVFTFTGSALVVTTVILASGFGLYMMGDFVPNIHFGLLCATILSAALVLDVVFMPALLMLVDHKTYKKEEA